MFATGMKYKWKNLVYVDLFSGAGRARIKGSGRIVNSSSMLAVNIPSPFDKYIFCDLDEGNIDALQKRIANNGVSVQADFLVGDCNLLVNDILMRIPMYSSTNTVLGLCLVDPFKADDIHFDTIECLSKRFVDFLILIPTYMDLNRNPQEYTATHNTTVDKYLGTTEWRSTWEAKKTPGMQFGAFIAKSFEKRMEDLKYRHIDNNFILIRVPDRNFLYHLSFYSRNSKGEELWKKARETVSDQMELFN
jgi:three-Cys-motif partner protein